MLKKQNRLRRINKTKEAITYPTSLFTLKVLKGERDEKKFGFIVSKKVSKSAVLRNRTKRILRSVVEDNIEKITSGQDFLLISKKKLEWKQKQEAKEALENVFKKAKILK